MREIRDLKCVGNLSSGINCRAGGIWPRAPKVEGDKRSSASIRASHTNPPILVTVDGRRNPGCCTRDEEVRCKYTKGYGIFLPYDLLEGHQSVHRLSKVASRVQVGSSYPGVHAGTRCNPVKCMVLRVTVQYPIYNS